MKFAFIALCLALTLFAQEQQEEYKNFTEGERLGTFAMNYIIPGSGSIIIMDDWTGAGIQWALIGTGAVLMADILVNGKYYDEWHDPNHNLIKAVAIVYLFGIDVLFNVTRSITYDNPKYVQQTLEKNGSKNFTAEQRFNTFEMNIIPGLGSIVIMDDWAGAITQWTLFGLGIMPLIDDPLSIDPFVPILLGFNILFNIYRSATYNNLKNVTFDECDGFHLSVLPNRHGKIMPHLVFSKAF
ncbi:hypothetical protein R83H12_01588 [Fibrobacteria bacterium R8-3-H12]